MPCPSPEESSVDLENDSIPPKSYFTPDWLDSWRKEDLVEAQEKDPLTKTVISYLKKGIKPDSKEIALFSSSIRTLFRRWEDLELIEGLLYMRVTDPVTNTTECSLVAPAGVRSVMFQMLHIDRTAGHLGREKTLSKFKQHVYWPGMASDIADWIRECDLCARRKPGPGRARNPMGHVNVGLPFQRIAIDIMSPLTESHDGFLYIMVVQCYFSKWVEAYCLVNHTAQSVGDKLLSQWICRFGVPTTIHTDQGPEFDSKLFKHLCQELGSLKTRTLPFHPQSDGMVERQNRTILQMLSCYTNDCHDDWSDHLDFVMMAYRSSQHESTGCSPNRVIFGRELNLPLTVTLGEQHYCQGSECPIEYVKWVKDTLEKVYLFVRNKSKVSTARQKRNHDKKSKVREVSRGTLVWRWYPPKGKHKLGLGWTGPYRVQELLGQHAVKLRSQDREVTVHLDDVKPYQGREYFSDEEQEPASDSDLDLSDTEHSESDGSPQASGESSPESEDDPDSEEVQVPTTRKGREVRLPLRYR